MKTVFLPLVIRDDSPFGNTSHNLTATKAQGLSQLIWRWTSGNPTTDTGSSSDVVSQHSDKVSSNLWSTGSSSRLNTSGKPPHDPLRKEDFTDTLVMHLLLEVSFLTFDTVVKLLSWCRVNSWCFTLGEGQQSSAIHFPGQMPSLCAFEIPMTNKVRCEIWISNMCNENR